MLILVQSGNYCSYLLLPADRDCHIHSDSECLLFLFGLSNILQLLRNGTGSKNALPPGIPDPAAELGAPIDLRYPAVYITRRGHEDIDEVVDPEFL